MLHVSSAHAQSHVGQSPWVFTDDWWREPQTWAVHPAAGWDDASVIAAFDFPAYEAMDVIVVSWFEGSRVAIDELHSRQGDFLFPVEKKLKNPMRVFR